MFDIGASELLMIVIVAVVVIGPKDMPMALRTAGRWIGKMRKMSNHFRSGIDAMVREAELEEMERKWREQNDAIMKAAPTLPSTYPTAQDMAAPAEPHTLGDLAAEPELAAVEQERARLAAVDETKPDAPKQAEFHLPPPPP